MAPRQDLSLLFTNLTVATHFTLLWRVVFVARLEELVTSFKLVYQVFIVDFLSQVEEVDKHNREFFFLLSRLLNTQVLLGLDDRETSNRFGNERAAKGAICSTTMLEWIESMLL